MTQDFLSNVSAWATGSCLHFQGKLVKLLRDSFLKKYLIGSGRYVESTVYHFKDLGFISL